ncbi:hypothetical protein GTR04_0204 [Trichophyton interdigitale]|nr:hypothetical protein GTR04_0204 [Trichophyton interdigitale]
MPAGQARPLKLKRLRTRPRRRTEDSKHLAETAVGDRLSSGLDVMSREPEMAPRMCRSKQAWEPLSQAEKSCHPEKMGCIEDGVCDQPVISLGPISADTRLEMSSLIGFTLAVIMGDTSELSIFQAVEGQDMAARPMIPLQGLSRGDPYQRQLQPFSTLDLPSTSKIVRHSRQRTTPRFHCCLSIHVHD